MGCPCDRRDLGSEQLSLLVPSSPCPLSSAQLNCLKGFIIIIIILRTVGSSKDCENGPIFKSKVEDLADTILSLGLQWTLS